MKIELKQIKVRDIVSGYTNNEEEGVTGFNGSLNIRPPTSVNLSIRTNNRKQSSVQL